jgi:hypothetical protein
MDEHDHFQDFVAETRAIVWPRLIFAEDLARITGTTPATARQALVEGRYGGRIRVGRRWAILRETLLTHLKAHEELPL